MGLKYTRVTPAGDPTNGPGRQPVLLWHDFALLGAIILDIPLNVVCVDPLAPKLARIFEQEIPEGRFASPSGEEESELFELAQNVEVLLTRGRAVGANLIEKARGRLKLVHVLGRHPLQVDRAAARTAGVTVATMPPR